MNILCFGDSNTWGYRPDRKGRFDENTRWTGLLQQKLGPEYHIIEEDMVGATVEIHNPIDLMIIMLGTNDCKSHYRASASLISKGLDQVIRKARLNASQHFDLLVISPIHLGHGVGEPDFDPEFDENSEVVSRNLAAEYRKVALLPSITDREHLDEKGHAALADAIYDKIIALQKGLSNVI